MDVQAMISNLGFPIFVSCWMLFKHSKETKESTEMLNRVLQILEKLDKKLEGG